MRRAAALLLIAAIACKKEEPPPPPPAAAGPAPGSTEWKIEMARSAAPWGISQSAQVMEMINDTTPPAALAAGTTGWSCLVDFPETPAPDPVCADSVFMEWVAAWQAHRAPAIRSMGIAYMLRGGQTASDTDPFKMMPDSGQPWNVDAPHVMVVMPNPRVAFAGLATVRTATGPFVMYAGTPYAHLMVPAAGTQP